MKKRYKLLAKVILIFIVALSVNLLFKPTSANADATPYTLDDWRNSRTTDLKLHAECSPSDVGARCTDVPDDKTYVFCSPYSAGRECRYPVCGDFRSCPTDYECQTVKSPNSGEYKGCVSLISGSTPTEVKLGKLSADLSTRKPILEINIPGLKFSNVMSSTDETGTYFYISWIPELISAIYKFGIAIVSIVAVVMIIIQGITIASGGFISKTIKEGGKDVVISAYKNIGRIIVGLMIAWGSFAILYNINPALVQFNALKVKVVEGVPLIQESDVIPENNYPTITNVQKPAWNAETFDCSKKTSYQPAGVVSPTDIISYSCAGLEGKVSTIKEMKDPLCQVGRLAIAEGYTVEIRSSYRDFNGQVNNWCGSGMRNYPNPQERKAFNATPGYSNHGHGRAVDAILKKNGKALFEATSKKQCAVNPDYIAKIANLFYAADPNFVRLETEIWHFEYGTAGQSARSRTTGAGSKCK